MIEQIRTRPVRSLLAAAVGLGGAVLATMAAMTNVTHRRSPELALRISPNDPVALTVVGGKLLLNPKARDREKRVIEFGRRSLEGWPLNAAGLSLVGYGKSAKNLAAGRPAMELAYRMNKANLSVHLWLIEAAVARNDVADALLHYDLAMRTSQAGRQMLFPVLTSALEDEALWPPFIRMLSEKPAWLSDFLRFAIRSTPKPAAYAKLIRAAGGLAPSPTNVALQSELLRRLIDQGELASALQLYSSLPGARKDVPASISFADASLDARFAPLTWETIASNAVSGTFLRTTTPGQSELQIGFYEPGSNQVASKFVALPAGRYRLSVMQRMLEGSSGALITWEFLCQRGAKRNIVWSKGTTLGTARTRFSSEVALPPGCSGYLVRILGQTEQPGSQATIESPTLERLG